MQGDLKLQQQWYVNGLNYSRTLDAWLARHNDSKSAIMRCLEVRGFSHLPMHLWG